jgi:hypothetical protein
MQKPQPFVAVSRPTTEAIGGIFQVYTIQKRSQQVDNLPLEKGEMLVF